MKMPHEAHLKACVMTMVSLISGTLLTWFVWLWSQKYRSILKARLHLATQDLMNVCYIEASKQSKLSQL